jgi:hypothetical protein
MLALASDWRDAALRFISESHHWGKAELAIWLLETSGMFVGRSPSADEVRLDSVHIDARLIEQMLENARQEVLAALDEDPATVAFSAIAKEHVIRCTDEQDVSGWAPSGNVRRLADRVLALLAADYLTRPSADRRALAICGSCGKIDADSCIRRVSKAPKARRNTLPYFPDCA